MRGDRWRRQQWAHRPDAYFFYAVPADGLRFQVIPNIPPAFVTQILLAFVASCSLVHQYSAPESGKIGSSAGLGFE